MDSRERRLPAEFEGDGDILGGYCRREEEDCTGAAAKCCNVEHVTDEVEQVIGDSKAKMGQGGGCRGHRCGYGGRRGSLELKDKI